MAPNPNTDDVISLALRNAVVLRETFKYLSTSSLLSCRLVNKFWNTEARSFIRDYRECGVRMDFDLPLCQNLKRLNETLEQVSMIPFNSLYVHAGNHTGCVKEAEMSTRNLLTKFPLKFISILDTNAPQDFQCPGFLAVLDLIRENSCKLLKLEIRCTGRGSGMDGIFSDWKPPPLPMLKKLSVASFCSKRPTLVKKILQGVPNLKEIDDSGCWMLCVMPASMYDIVKRLRFGTGDVYCVEHFADKLNHLEELIIHVVDEKNFRDVKKTRFLRVIEKLLHGNQMALRDLGIRCYEDPLLSRLKLPSLPSVNFLSISVYMLYKSIGNIGAVDFGGYFPNLRKVRICEDIKGCRDDNNVGPVLPDDFDQVGTIAPNASATTKELCIEANIEHSDLVRLQRLFPNVTNFSIQSEQSYVSPLGLVGNLWPKLESLHIVTDSLDEKDLEAEFCGLHEDELVVLRQQDDEFLQHVHLVPGRSCVGTMMNLRTFQIEYCRTLTERSNIIKPLLIDKLSKVKFRQKFADFVNNSGASGLEELLKVFSKGLHPSDSPDMNESSTSDESDYLSESTDSSDGSSNSEDSSDSEALSD